jgi:hypothetical protein
MPTKAGEWLNQLWVIILVPGRIWDFQLSDEFSFDLTRI